MRFTKSKVVKNVVTAEIEVDIYSLLQQIVIQNASADVSIEVMPLTTPDDDTSATLSPEFLPVSDGVLEVMQGGSVKVYHLRAFCQKIRVSSSAAFDCSVLGVAEC